MAEQDSDTPTTYTFSWDPPTETNGQLQGYLLTCETSGSRGGTPLISNTFEAGSRSGSLTELDYDVQYNCTVQARNAVSFSQPSNIVSFTVIECMCVIRVCVTVHYGKGRVD